MHSVRAAFCAEFEISKVSTLEVTPKSLGTMTSEDERDICARGCEQDWIPLERDGRVPPLCTPLVVVCNWWCDFPHFTPKFARWPKYPSILIDIWVTMDESARENSLHNSQRKYSGWAIAISHRTVRRWRRFLSATMMASEHQVYWLLRKQ